MTRVAVLLLAVLLTACGGDSDSESAPAATAQSIAPPPPAAPPATLPVTPTPEPEPAPAPPPTLPPVVPPPPVEPEPPPVVAPPPETPPSQPPPTGTEPEPTETSPPPLSPPAEPEPEPETPEQPVEPPVEPAPRGYSVREIVLPSLDMYPALIGDDGSVAGTKSFEQITDWQTGEIITEGDGFRQTITSLFVLWPDGTLRDFGELETDLDELETGSDWWHNEALSYYEGRFAAGSLVPGTYVGVMVGPEAYVLDTEAAAYSLRLKGRINQLLSNGDAIGTEGANWSLPSADRAVYWNGDVLQTVPGIDHDDLFLGSRALQMRDEKIYGTLGREDSDYLEDQALVFVWHLMTTGPDVVMIYPVGHPEFSIEAPPEKPEAETLHELIDEDDWWFGRVTFTHVHDVNAQGEILADGCTIAGCGSFVLAPPQQ